MKIEVVSIGTELLLSHIVNTNAAFAVRTLCEAELSVAFHVIVGDVPDHIVSALSVALRRADVVIAIGGLGSHTDDFTLDAVAAVTGRARQPLPHGLDGAELVGGDAVSAAALLLDVGPAWLICLPGRPRDLANLLSTEIVPRLRRRHSADRANDTRLLRTAGLMESTIQQLLSDLQLAPGQRLTFSSYAGQTDIRLQAGGDDASAVAESMRDLAVQVLARLGDHIYGEGDDRLEEILLRRLLAGGIKLTLAELATERRLTELWTRYPGASGAVSFHPATSPEEMAERLSLTEHDSAGDLTMWCRHAAEALRDDAAADLGLLLYQNQLPGGRQVLVTLASAYGVSVMQRSFGGHPANIEDWTVSLGLVHLRRWMLAHARAPAEQSP